MPGAGGQVAAGVEWVWVPGAGAVTEQIGADAAGMSEVRNINEAISRESFAQVPTPITHRREVGRIRTASALSNGEAPFGDTAGDRDPHA